MKKNLASLVVAASVLTAFSLKASAQTNSVTFTNFMTVTVTNIVTVTNEVAKPDALTKTDAAGENAKPKYPWESSISAGLVLARGNSDTMLITGSARTEKKTPKNEITLGADGAYGENDSVENVDTIHAFGQYNHLFTERFYVYVRAEGLHDGIADLQYRFTAGPGVGYYFIKETNTTFSGEAGSSYVSQRLGDVNDSYFTLRLAEKFEHKFAKYGTRIWESVEILPQVDDFNNYIMNAEVGFEAPISKNLSIKTYLVDNYINQPAPGREKNDVQLISAITYKF